MKVLFVFTSSYDEIKDIEIWADVPCRFIDEDVITTDIFPESDMTRKMNMFLKKEGLQLAEVTGTRFEVDENKAIFQRVWLDFC